MNSPTPSLGGRRLVERRVRHVAIAYRSHLADVDGSIVEVESFAKRGEVITLDPIQACRLDHEGALARPGETTEQINDEVERRIQAFVESRQITGLGALG